MNNARHAAKETAEIMRDIHDRSFFIEEAREAWYAYFYGIYQTARRTIKSDEPKEVHDKALLLTEKQAYTELRKAKLISFDWLRCNAIRSFLNSCLYEGDFGDKDKALFRDQTRWIIKRFENYEVLSTMTVASITLYINQTAGVVVYENNQVDTLKPI